MVSPQSPKPSDSELLKAFSKDRKVNECLKDIKTVFLNSYRKGHRGLDKQMAYTRTNQLLKMLDLHMVEIFNRLCYRERS